MQMRCVVIRHMCILLQTWAIEGSRGPKAAYRGWWHHFDAGYTTASITDINKKVQQRSKTFQP